MRTTKTMKQLIILSVVCLFALPGFAADEGDGGYAGAFYQVPLGARPTAMGGAYRSIANDAAGPLYNPAGLVTLNSKLFGSSYRLMEQDRTLGYLMAAFPVQGETVIAVRWLYAGSGSVTARDADGFDLGRDISFNNHEFSVLFAKRFERWVSFGANLNFLLATYPEEEASSAGFDVGSIVYLNELMDRNTREDFPVQDIRLALVVKHLGKLYKWSSENYLIRYSVGEEPSTQEDRVPIEIGLGMSGRFLERKLLAAVDVSKNEEQSVILHLGAEYFVVPEFALRAGFDQSRFTAGTGYVFKIGSASLAVDYAFSAERASEGSEHIFSFDLLVR